MPKHFFFDLDNTLTRSKSHIAPEHKPILKALIARADVVVVSGHGERDIRAHLEDVGGYYMLAQNGNFARAPSGALLWEHRLSASQVDAIHEFIKKARRHLAYEVVDENDIVDDRGCQVGFSLIGHHLNQDIKDAFDPDHKKRAQLLDDLKADVSALRDRHNIEILIAGTTNLDIIEKGKNKGYNIRAFIEKMDWREEDCIYVGDALFPGGNDETVIGVIPTRPVRDFKETYEYLQKILSP